MVLDHFKALASSFGWGSLVNVVPDPYGQFKSILSQTKRISLEDVQWQAHTIWGDPTSTASLPATFTIRPIDPENNPLDRPVFFQRVRSQMIAKCITNWLTSSSLKALKIIRRAYA